MSAATNALAGKVAPYGGRRKIRRRVTMATQPHHGRIAHPTGGFFDVRGIKIPVAMSAFPDELYQAPRSWAERAYPKLIHYNKIPKGGHFAAWEQPEIFVAELRAGFKSLR